LNHEKTAIPDNAKFYATTGQKIYESRRTVDGKFEFDNLPDSVKFGLQFDSIKLESGFVKRNFYKYGAELRFGYYDNILKTPTEIEQRKKR
jgi:hypothetical protein